ncbi:hypothetical protein CDD83_191 [Cordyceps sp. RAO-2017]|nr:hypothetical protein CDD83_191 [Cordyceps sp. RAO-2017]
MPRFSLFGHLEPVEPSEAEAGRLAACYTDKHPDAKHWLPGNKIHASEWMRFVVSGVYWVGGFGDRAYIGWIPVAEWKSVTADDWQSIRLPGEKPGWDENEWSSETAGEL